MLRKSGSWLHRGKRSDPSVCGMGIQATLLKYQKERLGTSQVVLWLRCSQRSGPGFDPWSEN